MDEFADRKFFLKQYEQLYRLCMFQSRLLRRFGEPTSEDETGERFLRLPQVLRRTGLSKRTIYRLEAAGRFPARRKLGDRAVGWPECEVRAWVDNPAGWHGVKAS